MTNEKQLIDVNAALEKLCEYCICGCYEQCEERCVEFRSISKLPTVDAVEVVHAQWSNVAGCRTICNNCGNYPLYDYWGKLKLSNCCPNCGAIMNI